MKQGDNEFNNIEKATWGVWKNHFGTLSISQTEHGHYASDLLAEFDSREEAEQFIQELPEDEE